MYSAKDFIIAEDLETAYQLLQQSNKNKFLAGGMWTRLGKGRYQALIDGSHLDLAYIRQEEDQSIRIGAFTTLRQIETNPLINQSFPGLFPQCLQHIVGVQFRNTATIGGNVYCKHGFSDVIPCLLVLGCRLHFYHQGEIALADYLKGGVLKDILVELILPCQPDAGHFLPFKHTATDLSVLNFAAARYGGNIKIAIGARPGVAKLWQQDIQVDRLMNFDKLDYEAVCKDFHFGSNMRGSASYRRQTAPALLEQCLSKL